MKNLDKEKGNINPSTIPQMLYPFGVRTQKRLQEASELTRYYSTVGCQLTVANTVYETVIWSFTDQWASLKIANARHSMWSQRSQLSCPSCDGL
eukprot:11019795-Ditylum_brightwellii.AAC.1